MSIQELLLAYDAAVVKQLARDQKLEIKNFGKDQVAGLLAKHFAQPSQVAHALAQLKPAERTVLDSIQRAGGEVSAAALKQILLQTKVVAPTPEKKNKYYGYELEPYLATPPTPANLRSKISPRAYSNSVWSWGAASAAARVR